MHGHSWPAMERIGKGYFSRIYRWKNGENRRERKYRHGNPWKSHGKYSIQQGFPLHPLTFRNQDARKTVSWNGQLQRMSWYRMTPALGVQIKNLPSQLLKTNIHWFSIFNGFEGLNTCQIHINQKLGAWDTKLANVNYKMHILYQQHPTAISVAYQK